MMASFRTVVEALQYWSQTQGDGPAFIFRHGPHGRHVLSWKQLYTLSGRLAAILRQRAVSRGQLVVNTLTNSPERVVCELAILMSGAASVNGQCLLADGSDLLRTLRVSRATAILVDPDVTGSPWNVLKQHVTVDDDDNVTSESLPDLKKLMFVRRVEGKGEGDLLGHLETLSDWFQNDDIGPDDTATVLTTSGTTGFSKLVLYSHAAVVGFRRPSQTFNQVLYHHGHTVFNMAPLGWVGGYVCNTIGPGATRVMIDIRADGIPKDVPELIWTSFVEERCTRAIFVPLYLSGLVEKALQHQKRESSGDTTASDDTTSSPLDRMQDLAEEMAGTTKPNAGKTSKANDNDGTSEKVQTSLDGSETSWKDRGSSEQPRDDSSTQAVQDQSPPRQLEVIAMGGLPVTRSMVRLGLVLSSAVNVVYGGTDIGLVSSLMVRDWRDYVDHDTGRPLDKVQVKIVSQHDEQVQLPADQLGLILVKMEECPRLLNDPEAEAARLTSEGFIRTGDVGRLDQRGHLIVEGRGSDAIMRGLYIFYPGWLEARICACPGVRDVIIVGVPDPKVNEELCACVVLESDDVTMQEVRQFVEGDIVAKEDDLLSPRPRYYLRFESFPVTTTDKPRRKAVKEQAAQMLGLSPGS